MFAAVISGTPTPTRICARTSSKMSLVRCGAVGCGDADATPVTTSREICRFVLSLRRTMVSIRLYTPDAVSSERVFVSGQYPGLPLRLAKPGETLTVMSGVFCAVTWSVPAKTPEMKNGFSHVSKLSALYLRSLFWLLKK